ncbi:MAG: CDP-alcohol phosphatidyltransferase family protein [Parachlamydiaceae bacterium]
MDEKKLKKIALLPNVVTAFGLSCGLFVIFKMTMTGFGEANNQVLMEVTAILLLAAFADLLDGAIARAIKAESLFGGFFDTLADAISFGVAPSVIILKTLSILPGTKLSFLAMMAALIFSICGVLRLVRYNVTALAAKSDVDLAKAHQKHFTGLPIPAAAASAVSLNLFLFSDHFISFFPLSQSIHAWVLSIALILLGYCMISRWKFPSIKTLEIRVASFRVVFFTVLAAVLIFYGVLHYFPLVFMVLSWSYVFIAWTFAIIRKIAGGKSKTLEEFEPDPDDLEDDFHHESL